MNITQVAVSEIVAGENDRQTFNQQELAELANLIKDQGLTQAPTLRPVDGGYEIVAGERRVRAMRDILGWTQIPAVIRELDDDEASAIMLSENTGRVDLNAIEEAEAYQKRQERGWAIPRIAETAGVTSQHVQNRLDLLELVPEIQHFVRFGQFPETFALHVLPLDNNRQRIALKAYNRAPSMPLLRWKNVIAQLLEDQLSEAQMGLFALESMVISEAEAMVDVPVKGRRAITGAAANRDLPPVAVHPGDSMAPIMDRYIRDLTANGNIDVVGAVANLYNLFVAKGWVVVRTDVELPHMNTGAGRVGEELHVKNL